MVTKSNFFLFLQLWGIVRCFLCRLTLSYTLFCFFHFLLARTTLILSIAYLLFDEMLQACTSSPHPPFPCSRLTWSRPLSPRSTSPARPGGRAGLRWNLVRFSILLGGGPATRVCAGPVLGSCGGVRIGAENFPLSNPKFWSLCRVPISPKRFPPKRSWLLQGGWIWLTLLSTREGGLRLGGNWMAGPVGLAVLKIIVAMELTVMPLRFLGFLHLLLLLPKQMTQCEIPLSFLSLAFLDNLFHIFPRVYLLEFLFAVCTWLEVHGEGLKAAYGPWREAWICHQHSCRLDEME